MPDFPHASHSNTTREKVTGAFCGQRPFECFAQKVPVIFSPGGRLWDDTINAMETGSRKRRVGKNLKEIIQLGS